MSNDEDKSLRSSNDPGFTLTLLSVLVVMLAAALLIMYIGGGA